jgi:hypothetical protein
VCVCVCVCIRRFYCLYGDSMNVAARMSANAKESGVCVSPQIAAHLASAAASRRSVSVSLPRLARFRGLETLNSTLNTPHVTALHPSLTETRVTSHRDSHSSDVALEEPDAASATQAHASACATPRLCVVSRGVHLILSHCIASHLTHVAGLASDLPNRMNRI